MWSYSHYIRGRCPCIKALKTLCLSNSAPDLLVWVNWPRAAAPDPGQTGDNYGLWPYYSL